MYLTLPDPLDEAKAHSAALQVLIQKTIKKHNKISFHDYMQQVLYEPGFGYYSAGSCKLGAGGDFITAPEISPLFGATIAKKLLPLVNTLEHNWLELGAGTGKLAESILSQLHQLNALPKQYYILEVSADLRQRQQVYLHMQLPIEIFSKIIWLDTLPEKFQGIIIANEVLDALPVHRFNVSKEGLVQEYFISLDKENRLVELLDTPSTDYLLERINQLNIEGPYSSEINLQQEGLLKALSHALEKGIILLIDYGFSAQEFYHPDRDQGTLMCHYQHRAHGDALFWPGLQDITAHIDFTALARAGIESGLSLIHFSTQSAWLLHANILALAQEQFALLNDRSLLLNKSALHKLIAPEEMGELFKFILFGKDMVEVDMTMHADMRHKL